MTYYSKIKDVTFLKILFWMIRSYAIIITLICSLIMLPYVLTLKQSILMICLSIQIIFLFSLLLSFAIHEYMHIYFLKKKHANNKVKIMFGWNKMTVSPIISNVSGRTIIRVAISPLLILFAIGLCFSLIYSVTNILLLKILSYIYCFHIVNILPPLGDGVMLIKGILKSIERR